MCLRLSNNREPKALDRRADGDGAVAAFASVQPNRRLARARAAGSGIRDHRVEPLAAMACREPIERKPIDAEEVGTASRDPRPAGRAPGIVRRHAPGENARRQIERGGAQRGGRSIPNLERGTDVPRGVENQRRDRERERERGGSPSAVIARLPRRRPPKGSRPAGELCRPFLPPERRRSPPERGVPRDRGRPM